MSVLPSFKHAFPSFADVEPVVQVADDSNFAHPTNSLSTLQLSTSHRHSFSWIQPTNSPSHDPFNGSHTPRSTSELLNTNTGTSTTSRPNVSLLPLDLVSGDAPAFGFATRPTSKRRDLAPLPVDVLGFPIDDNPYLHTSARKRPTPPSQLPSTSAGASHKRQRVQTTPPGDDYHANLLSQNNPTLFQEASVRTTRTSPTHGGSPCAMRLHPSTGISTMATTTTTKMLPTSALQHAPPRNFATPPSTDRLSSLSDALRASASPAPNMNLPSPAVDAGITTNRFSSYAHGSSGGRGDDDGRGRHSTVAGQSTASLFRGGSLRVGSLLGPISAAVSCDGAETADTSRRGSGGGGGIGTRGSPQLLAVAKDSTAGAPPDVLSIPAQRSLHSALSSRTMQLAGVGGGGGGGVGGGMGGVSGGVGSCGILSSSRWATASDVSQLGGMRSCLTQGEEGAADNQSDLVDGTDSLAKHKDEKNNKGTKCNDDEIKDLATTTIQKEMQWDVVDAVCTRESTTATTTTTTTTVATTAAAKTEGKALSDVENKHDEKQTKQKVWTQKDEQNVNMPIVIEEEGRCEARTTSGGDDEFVQCPHCPRRLRNQVTLQNHIRVVHNNNGNFQCSQCRLTFMWRSTLGNHVRLVHEKQRPYGCDECGKAFRWKSHLREHYWVVHKGEKPFKCETCGKTFGRKNNMQKHMRKHTDNNQNNNGVPRNAN